MNIYRGRTHTEVYLASILYDSIEDQDISSVKKFLIEKHADPNIILPKKGISCFHLTVGKDSPKFAMEVTSLIIQNGGDPNVVSDEGLTPVHIAAAWGRIDILGLLLSCGGDPQITDNCYRNALQYAVDENWDEAATLIKDFIVYQRLSICNDFLTKLPFTIVLDKVLVNNGLRIGEYEVLTTEKDTKSQIDLNTLPETDSQEYVLNWCNNHNLDCEPMESNEKCNLELSNDSLSCKNSCSNSDYKSETCSNYKCSSQSSTGMRNQNNQDKFYNVTIRKKIKQDNNYVAKNICKYKESSRESGILTLHDSSEDNHECSHDEIEKESYSQQYTKTLGNTQNLNIKENKDTSSDYCTCTDGSVSPNILEKAIYEFPTDNATKSMCSNNDQDLVSVSEIYKYTDTEEHIVLYEKRILIPLSKGTQNESIDTCSSLSSLPKSFTYDTDTLRNELTIRGFDPGPITKTTKRVYLRKLYHLKKNQSVVQENKKDEIVYSLELQKTLKDIHWYQDLTQYEYLEELIKKQFSNPEPSRKWREGTAKSSFTYLLLDPRITQNLPQRYVHIPRSETWETFLSAIFYVGKGKRSRPYSHFYAAVTNYNKPELTTDNKKINRILDIWKDNYGVVCLHIFQNVIPVEAYTREAAMITALKLENITNIKTGDFYGIAATWTQKQKNILGVYLLYRAMKIFLNEGERQLFPNDIE